MKAGLLLLAIVLAGGVCNHPRTSTVPLPSDSPAHAELGCALTIRREGAGLGLTFMLSNRSTLPKTIHYYRPFLQFDLRVLSEGRDLHIVRGDFDGPVAPAELLVPAGGTAKLETPVILQFATQAQPAGDALAWTVIGEPRTVELRAILRLEHESLPECIAHVDRT